MNLILDLLLTHDMVDPESDYPILCIFNTVKDVPFPINVKPVNELLCPDNLTSAFDYSDVVSVIRILYKRTFLNCCILKELN